MKEKVDARVEFKRRQEICLFDGFKELFADNFEVVVVQVNVTNFRGEFKKIVSEHLDLIMRKIQELKMTKCFEVELVDCFEGRVDDLNFSDAWKKPLNTNREKMHDL